MAAVATLAAVQSVPAGVAPFPAGLPGTLVFHSDLRGPDNPQGRSHIFTLDLASRLVAATHVGTQPSRPASALVARRQAHRVQVVASGNFDVYVMDADGRNVTRITDHPANDHDPMWMPDGQSLIFSSERDSRSDLYRVWLGDRRVDRLTHHFVGLAMMPNVSPDGKLVAFAAQTLQRLQFWEFQVHVLDLATGKTRALDNSGGACWPTWSPDGRSLANVLLATEPSTLQIRGADGSGARALAGDPKRWHYYPDWSTDGGGSPSRSARSTTRAKTGTSRSSPPDGSRPISS